MTACGRLAAPTATNGSAKLECVRDHDFWGATSMLPGTGGVNRCEKPARTRLRLAPIGVRLRAISVVAGVMTTAGCASHSVTSDRHHGWHGSIAPAVAP